MTISRKLLLIVITLSLLGACAAPPAPATLTPVVVPTASPAPTLAPIVTPEPAGPWWNDAVFYEIFVRSFKDSDGDGIGDFNGITQKLDYLQALGITALWLMPIHPSPSYHGYDVTDYYAVNPDYGTLADFKNLLVEAHQRGMRVIIDLVLNHTAYNHPWFQAALKSDPTYRQWYVWRDTASNATGPWGQQIWYKSLSGYYLALFWDRMPDLNYDNPAVRAEAKKIAAFWLQEVGIDGFRLDAVRYLVEEGQRMADSPGTHAFLAEWGADYRSLNPEAFTVGEAWTDNGNVSQYTKTDTELDSAFNFDLSAAILTALSDGNTNLLNFQLKAGLRYFPQRDNANFITNHDQPRVMTQLSGTDAVKLAKAKVAAAILLTAPGFPFIYYGEEIGMTGPKPDERIRTPMQWSAEPGAGFTTSSAWSLINADYKQVNVTAQTGQSDSLLEHYRALIALRHTHAALRSGETLLLDAGTRKLYAAVRYDQDEALLLLINISSTPLTADLYGLQLEKGPFTQPLRAATLFGSATPAAPDLNAQGGFADYRPMAEIPAYSTTIIQLHP